MFGFCLCFPSRFRDLSSLQERTTVGAVMARTAWKEKKEKKRCFVTALQLKLELLFVDIFGLDLRFLSNDLNFALRKFQICLQQVTVV